MARNPRNNKKAGSKFESDVAKDFNQWMFEGKTILKRHPSSGAEKSLYAGDIYPMNQLPKDWKYFVFHVECKVGYEKNIFITNAHKQILEWYEDAQSKIVDMPNEKYIWIIWKIPHKGILLITDISLGNFESIDDGIEIPEYIYRLGRLEIYDYKELIKCNFKDIFNIYYEFIEEAK